MRQGGAAEWAGRCCVRGDRRTTMVHGDDARESPTVVGHGECGARGHAAELGRRLFRHGFCVDFCRGVVFWVLGFRTVHAQHTHTGDGHTKITLRCSALLAVLP